MKIEILTRIAKSLIGLKPSLSAVAVRQKRSLNFLLSYLLVIYWGTQKGVFIKSISHENLLRRKSNDHH